MTEAEAAALRHAADAPVEARPGDLAAVASDLSAAFAAYPMFRWCLREDGRRDVARLKFFRWLLAEIATARGAILRPAPGAAAAVWIDSEKLAPNPLWKELQALPTVLAATGLERFSRMIAIRRAIDANHPMETPHAYLWLLGVRPEAQGLGVGSRLLAAGLARVDAAHRPSFLETSTEANVAFYQRHGYQVIQRYQAAADSPPSWSMWRDAVA